MILQLVLSVLWCVAIGFAGFAVLLFIIAITAPWWVPEE